MKIAVLKNHLRGQILYRSPNPGKKRRLYYFLNSEIVKWSRGSSYSEEGLHIEVEFAKNRREFNSTSDHSGGERQSWKILEYQLLKTFLK